MGNLLLQSRPKWIVFEGSEGSGKSTTIAALGAYLEQKNMQVEMTREPGGTALAESLRALLLNSGQEEIMPITELLISLMFFVASSI